MSGIVPIIIRLEIENKANFVEFSFSSDNSDLFERPLIRAKSRELIMSEKYETSELGNREGVNDLGRRTYAEVVVETFSNLEINREIAPSCSAQILQPTASTSSITTDFRDLENMPFYSGNPFVEKTSGVIHFYKWSDSRKNVKENCTMLCMLHVPSLVNCPELLKFVSPRFQHISSMKIVRDATPNQYMVIIKFKTPNSATEFYNEYNGVRFNGIGLERCLLAFVEKIDSFWKGDRKATMDCLTELPSCAVCLERLDDGILTVLCNHSFHQKCLEQWADTTCPVCRYNPTPEVIEDQKCFECGRTTDLWICLICGNVGCGRYSDAHAYKHFQLTSHTYTLKIGSDRVWDYAGDNYVHRLIHNAGDGKLIEFQRNQNEVMGDEKLEAIQLEYAYLLSTQLQKQRDYFEQKLADLEMKFNKFEENCNSTIKNLNSQLSRTILECDNLKKQLSVSEKSRQTAERNACNHKIKLEKALSSLSEEEVINQVLRSDREKLRTQVKELEQNNDSLTDQVRDLMTHFEAQCKIQESAKAGAVSLQEIQEGKVVITEKAKFSSQKRRKK